MAFSTERKRSAVSWQVMYITERGDNQHKTMEEFCQSFGHLASCWSCWWLLAELVCGAFLSRFVQRRDMRQRPVLSIHTIHALVIGIGHTRPLPVISPYCQAPLYASYQCNTEEHPAPGSLHSFREINGIECRSCTTHTIHTGCWNTFSSHNTHAQPWYNNPIPCMYRPSPTVLKSAPRPMHGMATQR